MKLVDKNQREFTIDNVTSLFDMASTFSWMEDSEVEILSNPHKVEVVDADGNPLEHMNLADSVADGQPMAIDVTFEATHSGRNRNFFNYNSEDLERGAASWKSPFSKPLLKNHDMYTEPLGRVQDFSFGPSVITDERDAITVTFRVTDQDAITKFLDGRYQTMSIGASCGHVTCNICGKDILKDEEFKFCGHMRGQKYKGEMAYWTAKDFNFKEGSVVNNPADDFAQVVRIQVVKNNEGNNQAKDEEEVVNAPIQDSEEVGMVLTDAESSVIDEILDSVEAEETTSVEEQVEDSAEEVETETVQDQEEVPTLEDLQQQIDELKTTLADCETTLTSKDVEIETLRNSEEGLKQSESNLRQQNLALALSNKRLLVDMVLMSEMLGKEVTDEAKEERRCELSAMKASELTDLLKTSKEQTTPVRRTLPPKVTSPGIVDNMKEKRVIADEKSKREDKEESTNQPTMKDLTDAFVGLFTRQC